MNLYDIVYYYFNDEKLLFCSVYFDQLCSSVHNHSVLFVVVGEVVLLFHIIR